MSINDVILHTQDQLCVNQMTLAALRDEAARSLNPARYDEELGIYSGRCDALALVLEHISSATTRSESDAIKL
jgi:hypothetical protein